MAFYAAPVPTGISLPWLDAFAMLSSSKRIRGTEKWNATAYHPGLRETGAGTLEYHAAGRFPARTSCQRRNETSLGRPLVEHSIQVLLI